MASTWAQIVSHEEPVIHEKKQQIPPGWVRLFWDNKNHKTVIEHNENDNFYQEKPHDLDALMSKAIHKMRARWEMHHILSGTWYDYDIHDDLDDYDESEDEYSESESEDEQNGHLGGSGYVNDEY
tara:strand:- start:50 stop:424 length:375 start_codon:yes stop_codon:yes gene_type:complete